MADPNALASMPPGVDPSEWIAAQRQMQLSDLLTQQAFTSPAPQQPAGGGKYYQAARTSPISALSKLAEAYMGRKAFEKGAGMNAQNYARALEAMSGGNVPQASAGASPPATAVPAGGGGSPAPGNPSPSSPTNPWNPQGLPPQVALRLFQNDPKEYANYLKGPEALQLARLSGQNPQAAAAGALTKQTAIEGRPGGTIIDPVTGQQMIFADPAKGEYYIRGQDGQVYALPIKNDATIQAARQGGITAAETAGKVANTPMTVPMGGGREQLMYPGNVPGLGNPPASQPPASPPGAQPGPPGPQPSGQPPQNRYFGAPPKPTLPGAPTTPPAGPDASLWNSVPKLAIPNTPGQTTDTFHQQLLKDAAAKHTELVNKYGSEADLADQKMQYNAEARKALATAELGPSSEFLTHNRAKLMEWGVPASVIPGSGSVTPTLELNKNLKQSALQGARAIFGSRMTQMEVRLQHEELSPSTSMTRDAIASLMKQDDIKQQYAKQRANDYSQYVQKGGDPLQFERWYSTHRPLTRFAAQSTTPPAALDRLKQHPETLPDFKSAFGWDPTQ